MLSLIFVILVVFLSGSEYVQVLFVYIGIVEIQLPDESTFHNISVILWWSVLLVEKNGVFRNNHKPVASNWHFVS